MARAKETSGRGLIAAEEYARFFLKHPMIAVVYLFGSVALRGDGHDVDLVLEVSHPKLGIDFLVELNRKIDPIIQSPTSIEAEYTDLSEFRQVIIFDLLNLPHISGGEFDEIGWGGLSIAFLEAIAQKDEQKANQIAAQKRTADLFLLPPGWQESEEVHDMLPNWASNRPWARRSFYEILVLQSRKYDPATGHFAKREKGTRRDELLMRRALREEKWRQTKERTVEYLLKSAGLKR